MKILVPVDGSRHSSDGLKVASHFAKENGARAYLITIIPAVTDIDLELSASERDRLLESMKRRGEDLLRKAKDAMRSYCAEEILTVIASAPSPAQEIVSFAEKERIDLIVIGSKGRNANGRFLLGSTAADVVRHSPCCVYVVKETSWT